MNRRLNPDLFDSSSADEGTSPQSASMLATRRLEQDLKDTKKKVSHLESLVEVLQSQVKHLTQSGDQRTELFSKAISELEKELHEHHEIQEKQKARLEEKLIQQQVNEEQIEALVERFNTSLAHFENKLSSLQKVISEKQMALMSYRDIIEHIVEELEKLKGSQS